MDLFESTQINNMSLANRFVRSATWEGMAADNGAATPGKKKPIFKRRPRLSGKRFMCR